MKQHKLYITRKNGNGIPELLFESDSLNACKGFLSFGDYSAEVGDRFQIIGGEDFELVEAYTMERSEIYAD